MAQLLSPLTLNGKGIGDSVESDAVTDDEGHRAIPPPLLNATNPTLFHKIQNQPSILTLLVSDSKLYAGTQNGELLVCDITQSRCSVKTR